MKSRHVGQVGVGIIRHVEDQLQCEDKKACYGDGEVNIFLGFSRNCEHRILLSEVRLPGLRTPFVRTEAVETEADKKLTDGVLAMVSYFVSRISDLSF